LKRTILFLASSPTDAGRLRFDAERRDIGEGLKRSKHRDAFDLQTVLAARVSDLRRAVLDYAPSFVHFSGHGDDGVALILEDDNGNSVGVDIVAASEFFSMHADNILCVLFNSCFSAEVAEAISEKSVPYTIGMAGTISDEAAINFAVSFYDALGAGKAVPNAYDTALNSLKLSSDPDASLPRLFKGPVRNFELPGRTLGTTVTSGLMVNLRALETRSSDESPVRLRYRSEPQPGRLKITYTLGYIDTFENGGPILPLRYQKSSRCAFDWEFPALDIQVFNPSPTTIFLTEATINVSTAKVVNRPLLTIKEDTQARFAGEMRLVNESWNPLSNVKLCFNIVPGPHTQYLRADSYKHEVYVDSIVDEHSIDLLPNFAEEGVDVQTICALDGEWTSRDQFNAKMPDGTTRNFARDEFTEFWDRLFGRFTDKLASLIGIVSMDGVDAPERIEVAFIAHVYLENKNRLGLPRPSSARYDGRLRFSESPYNEAIQLSQEIKSQEADRFTLGLAIPGTGIFEFVLALKDIAGNVVFSSRVVLEGFVPHSLAKRLSA